MEWSSLILYLREIGLVQTAIVTRKVRKIKESTYPTIIDEEKPTNATLKIIKTIRICQKEQLDSVGQSCR